MQDQELSLRLAQLLYNRKARDIVVLNVTHLTVLCDHMIIASGRNPNQVSSLADAVDEMMAQDGLDLRRSEGRREGRPQSRREGRCETRHQEGRPQGRCQGSRQEGRRQARCEEG